MEILQEILRESVSGGFWHFVGYFLIIGIPIRFLKFLISKPFRHVILSKHGYPPKNCNVDGKSFDKDIKKFLK